MFLQDDTDRKVIQLTSIVEPGMDNMSTPLSLLVALCDDGSMWVSNINSGGMWRQIPGPEHLQPMESAYMVREKLKKVLGKKYEEVSKLIRTGGGTL